MSLDIKVYLNFLENKCLTISEISVLPSLIAKLLSTVWAEIPCTVLCNWDKAGLNCIPELVLWC